jgi:hypothetical protein
VSRVAALHAELAEVFAKLAEKERALVDALLDGDVEALQPTPSASPPPPSLDRVADELAGIRARLDRLEAKAPAVSLADVVRAARAMVRFDPKLGIKRVYFLRQGTTGPIKIGFTVDLQGRIAALQTSNPYPVILMGSVPGDQAVEREAHVQFAHLRLHGEWFRPEPELLAFIDDVLAQPEMLKT